MLNGDIPLSPRVHVAGFFKSYGTICAVDGVDLEVQPGEIYGLIGPDGAGKSTLMKAIAGVLSFDHGSVRIFDQPVRTEAEAERVKVRMGFMPQGLGLNLYPTLSIDENINFFARLRCVPEDELRRRKQRLLEVTRLDRYRDRPMAKLSGGMKQKLGLVCTLIHEPELVILDEPTTGVDPVSRRDFWAILAEFLREREITALVSTAYMDEASRFHRMSLMYAGKVVAQGEPDTIQNTLPGNIVTLELQQGSDVPDTVRQHFAQVQTLGTTVRVFVPGHDREEALRQVCSLVDRAQVIHSSAASPELEDIFVQLLLQRGLVKESPVVVLGDDLAGSSETPDKGNEQPAIEARELTKKFGSFTAVDRISFQVPRGEIFGLLGANGAGKTTVIKMLTGIIRPSDGNGQVAGVGMQQAGRIIKERIGYMSQMFSLYRDLTVLENIRLYAGIYGLGRKRTRERIDWVVSMAGLAGYEKRLAGSLPMGVGQRLALGCALVHRPQVIFLDEPTSGVDPVGRRLFWDILFRLSREQQVTIMLTTHYMSESEHCDHLALMYNGRIVADGSPAGMKADLNKDAGHLLEVGCDRPLEGLAVLEKKFQGVALFGKKIHLLAQNKAGAKQEIRALLEDAGIRLTGVSETPLSMEDVFVYRVLALEQGDKI